MISIFGMQPSWLQHSWLAELGEALLHSSWQITLIGAAYWALQHTVLTARVKHDLGMLALFAAVAWPAISLLPNATDLASTPIGPATLAAADVSDQAARSTAQAQLSEAPVAWLRSSALRSGLGALWLLGAVFMATRLGVGLFELRRIRRHASDLGAAARIRARIQRLGSRVGLRAATLLRLSIRVPDKTGGLGVCTFGLLRPVLVVPMATIAGLSPAHLDAVLLHELAHLQRRDGLWAAIQSVLDCLLFFHPVARWVSGRVRQHRELACDDLAIATGLEPSDYARALLCLARQPANTMTAATAATGGHMTFRIRRILERQPIESSSHPWSILCLAILLAPVILAVVGGGTQTELGESSQPAELVMRAEVLTFSPTALPSLRSASFGTTASEFSGAILDRSRERLLRPLVDETLSTPMIKMLEGSPASISTGIVDPEQRDRFRTDNGRIANGILRLEFTAGAVTTGSALLDLAFTIEPNTDAVDADGADASTRLVLSDVVVTKDRPLFLYETGESGGAQTLRGVLLELVSTSKERPKAEQPVSFAVQDADYDEVLNTILRYLGLDRDDSTVDLRRFDVPITLQAQQVPAGEMLEIVLRMNCLGADIVDETARIFEMPDCEPSSRGVRSSGER